MTAPQDPFAKPPAGSRPYQPPAPGSEGPQPGQDQSGPQQYGQPGPAQPYGQPGYGQPGYGQPGYGQPGAGKPRNGLGIAALVLGVLAFFTSITVIGGIVFGLAAIVLGIMGRGRVKRREATNGGMAIAGVVLGVNGIVLAVALIALGASLLNSESGQELRDCLDGATTQPQIDQCSVDFSEDISN